MASIAAAAGAPAHVVSAFKVRKSKPVDKPTTLQELVARTAKRETPTPTPGADNTMAQYTKRKVDRANSARGGLASTVMAEDKLG